MTPGAVAALVEIKGYAGANRIRYTQHARDRMNQRNIRHVDVRAALVDGRDCRRGDSGWVVTGPDADGDDLDVVAAIADGVVVITVY